MATMAGPRKTISIHDYPEHLNPFREDDNHNKIRFWTIGRKLNRSNSISFNGIKDLRNSWSLRSFMKKGKKVEQPQEKEKPRSSVNNENNIIEYRNALQYSSASWSGARNTVGSPEQADRYVYGGSVTPLPRSRFQERLRSPSNYEVNSLKSHLESEQIALQTIQIEASKIITQAVTPRMTRSEVSGSRHSVESTNPFDEDEPIPPVRAPRRKKKRAAPLPPIASAVNISANGATSESQSTSLNDAQTSELNDTQGSELNDTQSSCLNETQTNLNDNEISPITDIKLSNVDDDMADLNCNIELKIVEDDDQKTIIKVPVTAEDDNIDIIVKSSIKNEDSKQLPNEIITQTKMEKTENSDTENTIKNSISDDDILQKTAFPKVDIVKYRRNSSVNDDDIRLRRGNLEDFHALSYKRSKSLTNTVDGSYIAYDINLNEDRTTDANGNEEPQKVVCKMYEDSSRKQSIDTVSSTEKEFIEIDKATRELEREISKLNSALTEDNLSFIGPRRSVSDIKRIFDNTISSPNPIPKPRRSHHGDISTLAVNGNVES